MTSSYRRVVAIGIASAALVTLVMHDANAQPSTRWPIHSTDRPQPRIVKPPANTLTVAPPSDATVLFGGADLSHWQKDGGGAAGWKVENGYEVQVLDSYENKTYPDGQASALYGQFPPLVNASRPPGEWQMYDIIFHRPRFDAAGKVTSPARFTVLHNGVLVQDNVLLSGPTAHQRRPPYEKHEDRLPMSLQDHGTKVRYRNIWIRDLEKP
jgi:hypothetical protein